MRSWRDSLAAAAAALYRVTGKDGYLTEARRHLARSKPTVVLGYFNLAPLAAADICGRLGAPPLGGPSVKRQACRFFRRNGRRAAAFAGRGAFGLAGPAAWGTTSTNGAGAAIAALSGRRSIAAGARDYLLGRNPWGASFLAGFGQPAAYIELGVGFRARHAPRGRSSVALRRVASCAARASGRSAPCAASTAASPTRTAAGTTSPQSRPSTTPPIRSCCSPRCGTPVSRRGAYARSSGARVRPAELSCSQ